MSTRLPTSSTQTLHPQTARRSLRCSNFREGTAALGFVPSRRFGTMSRLRRGRVRALRRMRRTKDARGLHQRRKGRGLRRRHGGPWRWYWNWRRGTMRRMLGIWTCEKDRKQNDVIEAGPKAHIISLFDGLFDVVLQTSKTRTHRAQLSRTPYSRPRLSPFEQTSQLQRCPHHSIPKFSGPNVARALIRRRYIDPLFLGM